MNDYLRQYDNILNRKTLSPQSRRAYRSRVMGFLAFLTDDRIDTATLLDDCELRNSIVKQYLQSLRTTLKPASVDAALTSINDFFISFGVAPVATKRGDHTARMLTSEEIARFLKQIERCKSSKVRALAKLFLLEGLRLTDCISLNIGHVQFGNTCTITLHNKRSSYEVIISKETARDLESWCQERQFIADSGSNQALFVSRSGSRLTPGAIDFAIRTAGHLARVELSIGLLRRVYLNKTVASSIRQPIEQEFDRPFNFGASARPATTGLTTAAGYGA